MYDIMYTLNELNENRVSVITQKTITVGDAQYPIGNQTWKAYVNSLIGRIKVVEDLPKAQQNAIFAVWGDSPTVLDEEI